MPTARQALSRRLLRTLTPAALAVVTLAGCAGQAAQPATPPGDAASSVAGAGSTSTATPGTPGPNGDGSDTGSATAATSPSGAAVPESGSGASTEVEVPGRDTSAAKAPGRVVRYTVEVEGGLERIAQDFPAAVRTDLTDLRGWQKRDGVRFVHVTPAQRAKGAGTDIRIILASPRLVDKVCAPLRTNGRLSCHDGGKVMLNAWRWVHGAETYGNDLATYRIYLVNHEVGHSIGHGHASCPRPGAQSPVMLQQTLRLEGCRPYPYPVG